jgi:hypothetical protein
MKATSIIGAILIVAGILALVYGGFTYTKDSETASLGPIELTVHEKESVNIPVWAGVGSIVVGAGLLAVPLIKR